MNEIYKYYNDLVLQHSELAHANKTTREIAIAKLDEVVRARNAYVDALNNFHGLDFHSSFKDKERIVRPNRSKLRDAQAKWTRAKNAYLAWRSQLSMADKAKFADVLRSENDKVFKEPHKGDQHMAIML